MKNRTYIVNNWSIDLDSGFITHRETQELKRLGEYQLKLITVLLEHVGEILSRDELTTLVWKRRIIGNNSLPNAIHTLRVALGDENKQQRMIQTIPKMGYLLDPTFCEIIEEITSEEVAEPTQRLADSTPVTSAILPS
ncbi:Transcriptional regulator [Yersinia mollaretii ATCC 43969]|uniref:Transcriptional regulator n=2 Tax=Yersinia mollaretii TaxID=33060 RepID=A0ABP2ECS1_YERMW|nr:transcriptional regulator [Yersinia mollaretii]EEQ08976.1 Transcriptional regulator [Yersinia mollaretii ATCC 43969]